MSYLFQYMYFFIIYHDEDLTKRDNLIKHCQSSISISHQIINEVGLNKIILYINASMLDVLNYISEQKVLL